MDKDTIKETLKGNILRLIEMNEVQSAVRLLEEYQKLDNKDIHSYLMLGTLYANEGAFSEALSQLEAGLSIEPFHYDLMVNLGILYEVMGKPLDALACYRKTLTEYYYEIDRTELEERIQAVKENITSTNLGREANAIASIDNLLFITSSNNEKVDVLASRLNQYGINVDIAYCGRYLINNSPGNTSPYRKVLRIANSKSILEYADLYQYDCIQFFDVPKEFSSSCRNTGTIVLEEDIRLMDFADAVDYLYKHKKISIKQEVSPDEKDFTVLLLTYNRPINFYKVLNSFGNFKHLKPKIIVLDSSKDEIKNQNLQAISSLTERLEIDYYAYENGSYAEKFFDGLKKIKTEFFAISPDDDYFAEEGLIKSLNVLRARADVMSIKGRSFFYTNSKSNLTEYDWLETLDHQNCLDRIRAYTGGFAATITNQMFRTKPYLSCMSFYENHFDDVCDEPIFQEYLINFVVIITGKIVKINTDLNIRNKGIEREFNVRNFDTALIDGTFNHNYGQFINYIMMYTQHLGLAIEKKEIEQMFIDLMVYFLQIPIEYIEKTSEGLDIALLRKGMTKSWVWRK